MIVTISSVADFDQFLRTFSTEGVEKRREHGCKGGAVRPGGFRAVNPELKGSTVIAEMRPAVRQSLAMAKEVLRSPSFRGDLFR
jgi:hypothetical protein